MTSFSAMRRSTLACLAFVLSVPATTWAQRTNDDADSYSEARNSRGEAEPPRLMRGGIMQQLRSVTESVIGTGPEDKANSNAKPGRSEPRAGLPTPPPLTNKRPVSEPRGRSYAPDDFQSQEPQPTAPERPGGAGRAWAGQFLIPNYPLRNQVGTRTFRGAQDARRNPVSDAPAASPAEPEMRGSVTGARVARLPESSSPAQRRVYLGQRPAESQPASDAIDDSAPPREESEVDVAVTTPGASTVFRLSDEPQGGSEEMLPPEEPAEVLVSHVPDVPYVPRKPLPKRPAKVATQPAVNTSPNSPSAANKSTPSPAKPSVAAPSGPTTSPAINAAPANTAPSTPAPTLELSSKMQGHGEALSASVPSVPSKPLPTTSAAKVPAKAVSTPAGSPPPGKPMTTPAPETRSVETKPRESVVGPSLSAPPSTSPSSTPSLLPPSMSTSAGPSTSAGSSQSVVPTIPSLEPSLTPPGPSSLPPAGLPPSSLTPALPPAGMPPSLTPPTTAPTALPPSTLPTAPPTLPPSTLPPATLPPTTLPHATLPPSTLPPATLPPTTLRTTSPTAALPPTTNSAPLTAPPAALPKATPAATLPATPAATLPATTAMGPQPRLQMEIPHVAVQLLGPGDLTAGTPTAYELQAHNSDSIALNGLILRMETPAGVQVTATGPGAKATELEKTNDGATLLTWTVSGLKAGGTTSLPLQLTSSTARNFAVAIEWTVLPQSGLNEITVKQPDLQIALEGPVDVEKSGSNAYQLRVSNPGSAPAKGVKVVVSTGSPDSNAVDLGDLNPGQTEVIELDLTFEKAGQVQIGAVASSGSLSRSTAIQVNVHQAVVETALAVPENILHGSPIIAQVVVGNSGDAPARNLQAALHLPAGTEVVQLPAGMSRDADRLLMNIDQIPAGQEISVPVELRLATPGTHELSLVCVSPAGTTAASKAAVTVEAFADLKLSVNDPVAPAPVGSPVTYELTITNRGSRDANNVNVVAQFSDGIEPESAAGWKHQVVPGQVRFETVPQLGAGQSLTLKVVAKAAVAGVHRFRAEVRCEDNEARLVQEESTRYLDSTGRIAAPPSTTIQR